MAVHVPAGATCQGFILAAPLGVNGHHDALRAVFGRRIFDHLRVGDGGGIKAGFVSPGIQQPPYIIDRAHPAADGERNKHLAGHRFDDVQNQIPAIAGGGNVKKSQLVRTLLVVACSNFHRVTCITQLGEINAFDNAAAGDV